MDGHCGGEGESLRWGGQVAGAAMGLGKWSRAGQGLRSVRALREGSMGNWGSEEESEVFVGRAGGWGS